MEKSYVGLKRAAMIIMYILAVLQLLGSISSATGYALDAGNMAWNWIWAAIGFIAAILLTNKSRGAVLGGSFIALASGVLSLVSSIYGLSMTSGVLSDMGLGADVVNIAMGVTAVMMVIGSCIYFLVFILGFVASRRMPRAQETAYQPSQDSPQYAPQNAPPQQGNVYCSKCGEPNVHGAGFCSKCGAPLAK